jgi:predicted Rossmann fold flavoprotein
MDQFETVVIGAGAAGMFCAIEVARRGRRVLLIDHNKAVGEKIRISGGGRCNFTNLHCAPNAFLSANPKFAISALSRYSQWDFIDRMAKSGIAWHEKTLGQLFCDGSAKQIIDMLRQDMASTGVVLQLGTKVADIRKSPQGFQIATSQGQVACQSLVIATGGKSIPKMGASGFGYQVARQFGLPLQETRPGLVPLTFSERDLADIKPLAGLSLPAAITCDAARFAEGMLFTHRGLSGPSILQISSYWREGEDILVDLMPGLDACLEIARWRSENGKLTVLSALAQALPRRLAALVIKDLPNGIRLADLTAAQITGLSNALNRWALTPSGSEGYRTAEVTLGGVDTLALDSQTMQARAVPGLYFIGEVVDVTGWLGGYNFQWAWSSGWAAGQSA